MDARQYRDLDRTLQHFTREHGILLSPMTKRLIHDVLDAVVEDPHPRWKADEGEIRKRLDGLIAELGPMLRDVAKEEGAGEEVTSFDFLHWLSQHLDAVCPFAK